MFHKLFNFADRQIEAAHDDTNLEIGAVEVVVEFKYVVETGHRL